MKTLRYYFPVIALVFCVAGCNDEDETPTICSLTVETQDATVLGNNSAELSFKTSNGKSHSGIYKTGILYDTDISLTNAKDEFQAGNNSNQFSKTIESLTRNTTYYFKGYVEDSWGNRIEGETRSFTTRNDAAKITTGKGVQTGAKTFFINPTGQLCYRFDYTLYSTLTGSDEVENWGINVYDSYTNKKYDIPVREGEGSISFWVETTYSTISYNFQAYAKLKNGTLIYGNTNIIYLRYQY